MRQFRRLTTIYSLDKGIAGSSKSVEGLGFALEEGWRPFNPNRERAVEWLGRDQYRSLQIRNSPKQPSYYIVPVGSYERGYGETAVPVSSHSTGYLVLAADKKTILDHFEEKDDAINDAYDLALTPGPAPATTEYGKTDSC